MSDPPPRHVDTDAWIARAPLASGARLRRQASEIVLAAMGLVDRGGYRILLKGGIQMALGHGSPRETSDIDFTALSAPDAGFRDEFAPALSAALRVAAARLGRTALVLDVQRVKEDPYPFGTAGMTHPSLNIRIGYAERKPARAPRAPFSSVVELDINFNERTFSRERLVLGASGIELPAYGVVDLVAEKMRALLQQTRQPNDRPPKPRRQDVYDIAYLAPAVDIPSAGPGILEALLAKCASVGIDPTRGDMERADVRECARSEWRTLALELDVLPDFDACFGAVVSLYRALPWRD